MKIAIFSPYRTVSPHFETELEIAERHLAEGDVVTYIGCQGELPGCDFNLERDPAQCLACSGRRLHGLSVLRRPLHNDNFQPTPRVFNESSLKFHSLSELINYRIDNFDVGYAALSSLVSHCRNPKPDLTAHQPLLANLIRGAVQVYDNCLDYIQHNAVDRIYVFNGRFASMRAVLRACQAAGVDCWIHERGCDMQHYATFANHLPHDIAAMRDLMIEHAQASGPEQVGRAAQAWYIDRRNRVVKNWHSFVAGQDVGALPPTWDPAKRNVAIFTSSDDEFVAIGDCWANRVYKDQLSAIQSLCIEIGYRSRDIQFYLRMHPNLAKVENSTKHQMLHLNLPNLTIIPPDSPVDSYRLLEASEKVVTFGSTMGIEAVYWGRPSILMGPCYYQDFPGPYRVENHDQAVNWTLARLGSGAKQGAEVYGHWMQTFGTPFEYFEAENLFHGKFKGEVLYDRPLKEVQGKWWQSRFGRLLPGRLTPAR